MMIELMIAHFLLDIVNNTWQNYTWITQNGLTGITQTYQADFPWFTSFILLVIYLGMVGFYWHEDGRQKYIGIALIGWIIATVMRTIVIGGIPLLPATTWDSATGVLLFVLFAVTVMGG